MSEIGGIQISNPTPQDNNKKLDGIEKRLKTLTTASQNMAHKATNAVTSKSIWQKPLMLILWFAIVTYAFLELKGLTYTDELGNSIIYLLNYMHLNFNTVWWWSGQSVIAFIAAFIVILIYFDVVLLLPLTYILSIRKDPTERMYKFLNFQMLLVVIILVPLLTSAAFYGIFGDNTADQEQTINNFKIDTQSTWENLKSGPFCVLINPVNYQTACMKEEKKEATKTSRAEYDVYLDKDFIVKKIEDFTKWQQKPLTIPYQIKAKGEPLYLEKIECYYDKEDKEHLITNKSLDKQKVESYDRKAINDIGCDLTNAKINAKYKKDYKIITKLYYSFDGDYTQEIPIYNMDLYIAKKYGSKEGINILKTEADLRQEYKNSKSAVKMPSDAIKLSTSATPPFPVLLGEDYDNEEKYDLTFNFERQSTADKLISTQITDYDIPQIITQDCLDSSCDEIKGPLVTTNNDLSQKQIRFSITNSPEDRESYDLKIVFKINHLFVKTDTITFDVTDPDYVEKTKDTQTTTSTSTSDDSSSSSTATDDTKTNQDQTTTDTTSTTTTLKNPFTDLNINPNTAGEYNYNSLYYKISDNKWLWSYDSINWMPTSTTTVSGGYYDGKEVSEENAKFIKSLN